MALNESEFDPNVTNQTLYIHRCSGWEPTKAVKITTYSLLMFLTLLGNSLTVAVFYRNKTMRSSVHYFITNMAFSDLIIPAIVLPYQISGVYHDYRWLVDGVLGAILCKAVWATWELSASVSIFSMIVIAVGRFYAIMFPLKTVLFARKASRLLIALSWITSFAFNAQYFYAFRVVRYDTGELYCFFQWKPASKTPQVEEINWILFLCLFLLSAVILIVLYSSIIVKLLKKKNSPDMASEVLKMKEKENKRITFMLALVVVVFYAVWIPYIVENIIHYVKPTITSPCVFTWLSNMTLPMLYHMINPVIYYIFNKKYRQGFRELLCLPWCRGNKLCHCLTLSSPSCSKDCATAGVNADITTENTELQKHSVMPLMVIHGGYHPEEQRHEYLFWS